MSKKKPILGILLIGTILIAGYGTSVVISVINIGYLTGDMNITPNITVMGFPPEYEGFVTISTVLEIENNGFYDIKELGVNIKVTATNWEISSPLNGIEVASGSNFIGTIVAGETWEGNLEVNITNFIPNLAIEDCTLLVEVTINLIYQPLIDIPISFTIEHSEPYNAPF